MNLLKWIKHIAVREPVKKVSEILHGRQILALYILCIPLAFFFSALFSGYFHMDIPRYEAGDIARSDVVVPSDIFIKDEEATKAKQVEAKEKSLPVYRLDPTVQSGAFSRLSSSLIQGRKLVESETAKKRPRKPAFQSLSFNARNKLRAIFQDIGFLHPSDDFMSFIVRENSTPVLENKITDFLKQAYPAFVIPDDSAFPNKQTKVYAANIRTGKTAVAYKEQIMTTGQARESIQQRLAKDTNLPEAWKPYIRQILDGMIAPNFKFDAVMTAAKQEEDAGNVDPVLQQLKKGKIVIRQGDEIGPLQIIQIEAIRNISKGVPYMKRIIGMGSLIALTLFIFLFFLRLVPRGQWRYARLAVFCLIILVVNLLLIQALSFISQSLSQNFLAAPFNDKAYFLYILPFAYGSMLVALLAGESCALLFILMFSVLVGQSISINFHDFFYVLLSGLIGIVFMRKAVLRVGIIWAGFKLGLAAVALFFLLQLMQQDRLNFVNLGFGGALAFLSGPLNAFFLMFTLPLCEYLFMVTTEIRLSELGNLNLPLVRELIVKAPGTYNHSIAVGTLCEGAAKAIGQNPLFLRVASLYHDIGKSLYPEYFAENQGQFNPHDTFSPDKSVSILKAHVAEGCRIAAAAKLPPSIVDLIIQHHGTRIMRFFYEKAKTQADSPGEVIPDHAFRYPGPKPQTKAACILMLADSIEAASRTLNDHSRESILNLIQGIIGDAAADGQFSECDITLAEIDHIAFSFLETLLSYYHERVVYPGFDTPSLPSLNR